jgi:ABC-type glycerol-3-phosphate transport system permease component
MEAAQSSRWGEPGRVALGRRRRAAFGTGALLLLLSGFFVLTVLPLLWLVMTSFKPSREIFLAPFQPPTQPTWDNYWRAWQLAHFGDYFSNSVSITLTVVVATLLLGSMSAYAIARLPLRGARTLHFLFLAGLMIPVQLAVVPLFFQMKALGLTGSRVGLGLVYLATSLPFAVFLLVGFFKSLPSSLREAALLEGASEWRIFWEVMLPLARPGLATVAIMTFLGVWNEYLVAFILLSGQAGLQLRTLPLGLANLTLLGQFRTDFGLTFAGIVLVMLPTLVVYVALERHLTDGLTMGANKE